MMTLLKKLTLATHTMSKRACESALLDAFEYAEECDINQIANTLLSNPSEKVHRALIRRYHRLDYSNQQKLLRGGADVTTALDHAACSASTRVSHTAIELIEARRDWRSLGSLLTILNSGQHANDISAAGHAILIITQYLIYYIQDTPANSDIYRFSNHNAARRLPATQRDRAMMMLDQTLATAMDTFPTHRNRDVLLAAALCASHAGPRLQAIFDDAIHPSHMAMRGVLNTMPVETLAPNALYWLDVDLLSKQVLRYIPAIVKNNTSFESLLHSVHLTMLPTQRRRLSRLDHRITYVGSLQTRCNLSEDAQYNLVPWIASIPATIGKRIEHHAEAIAYSSTGTRRRSLYQLIQMRDDAADREIRSFCFDEDVHTARLALLHCLHKRTPDTPRLLRRLLLSPHQSIRQIVATHSTILDFESVWERWEHIISSSMERLKARQLMQENRIEFVNQLRKRLLYRDRQSKLRAIQIVDELRLLENVELELLSIVRGDDSFAAAAATTVLGRIDSPASTDVITACLQHPNARVRANAIEAINSCKSATVDKSVCTQLEILTTDAENRPRANAIYALSHIDQEASSDCLSEMLCDKRPMHRISALWVVGQLEFVSNAHHVSSIALHDESKPVRKRARKTAKMLLGKMMSAPLPDQTLDQDIQQSPTVVVKTETQRAHQQAHHNHKHAG